MNLLDTLIKMGYTRDEAKNSIVMAREELEDLLAEGETEAAYDICMDYWGLEPDYLMDLM